MIKFQQAADNLTSFLDMISDTPPRTRRFTEGRSEDVMQFIPMAAPLISKFMSKILKPLATTIMSRKDSADEHKHRIMNNFLPAVIQTTKMAGTKVADNINCALGSKQYS